MTHHDPHPSPANPPRLAIRDLHHRGAPGFSGLSLEASAGEVLAVPGPAGRALLRLLAGFARPERGILLLDGRDLAALSPRRRPVGWMAADYPLFDHLTLAENLAFVLELRGVSRAARRRLTARALNLLELAGATRPAALAGLALRRALLARALVAEPLLLLLEAPLAGLDPPGREALRQDIVRIRDQLGVTVLHATESAADALTLSDRIAVLVDGRLRQLGTPAELYDEPADLTVTRLLGESNCLTGRAEAIEDDIVTVRLTCGPIAEAQLGSAPIQVGEPCVLAVRPERVALAAVSAAEMGEGSLPATVIEVFPRGDHVRLRLLVGEPGAALDEMVVRRPGGLPVAGLAPGATAAIAWQPEQARVFPRE